MKHVIGIGHSHLHSVSNAWREWEVAHSGTIRYTPICVLDAPYSPFFAIPGDIATLNPAIVAKLNEILASHDDVSIFLYLGGADYFRWSLTPGPCPFDFVDPFVDDGADPIGQVIPYQLMLDYARGMLTFSRAFVEFLTRLTARPLVQVFAPPPVRDLTSEVKKLPDWAERVVEYGVSPLAFREKMWRLTLRATQDICADLGIACLECPPEVFDPLGGLRDEFSGDLIHANANWGRLIVRRLMQQFQPMPAAA